MPRFKPRLTETLTHKTGQKVDCFYDPNDKLFKAELYKQHIVKPSHEELTRELYSRMDKAGVEPVWQDVIQINETKPFTDNEDHYFGFKYSRFHLWQRLDGKFMTGRWKPDESPEERLKWAEESYYIRGKLEFPYQWKGHDVYSTLVPYTPETWLALGVMQDKLLDLKGRFRALLSCPEGITRLEAFGTAKLLGGGMTALDHARMIRREAEHRRMRGQIRVALHEDAWIVDHNPAISREWPEQRPVERYLVRTQKNDDRYYTFDIEAGKKLAGVEVSYIEEPSPRLLLGSGLDE